MGRLKSGKIRLKNLSFTLAPFTLACTLLTGCAVTTSLPESPKLNPLKVNNTHPLSLDEFLIEIPEGAKLGDHHEDKLKVPSSSYQMGINFSLGEDLFKDTAKDELVKAGYTVFETEMGQVEPEKVEKAKFLLRTRITRIICNSYDPRAGSYSESYITVTWELRERERNDPVFQKETTGSVRSGTQVVEWAVLDAFKVAVRNLLADRAFSSILTAKTVPNSQRFYSVDLPGQ